MSFQATIDTVSKRQFLVDTGAEVSVLPATGLTRAQGNQDHLCWQLTVAQSGHTESAHSLFISPPTHIYQWDFVIADVSRPLLGADFLHTNSLLVDLKGKRLMDAATYHSVPLQSTKVSAPHLDTISSSTDQYDLLLAEFPDITTPNFVQSPTKHGIEHFITTKGPPVHAREPAAYLQTS